MRLKIAALTVAILLLVATAASAAHYTVASTAYSPCSAGTTMANGHHVRWGAVANNFLALGTKIRLDHRVWAHRGDGRLVGRRWFTVADRIGWGSSLDIWMPNCQDAINYGRRTAGFAS